MSAFVSIRREATALLSGGNGPALGVVALPWALLLGIRMSYPVLLPHLRVAFGLSLTAAGLLMTIMWLGGSIGQLPGGVLTDRHSERSIMAASTLIVAVALVFVVTAPTTLVLFAATGLWGLGHSLYPIARITILSDIYPDRIGSALGVTMATGDVGQTVLPPLAGVLALAVAWQVGLGYAIPLLLLSSVVLLTVLPDPGPKESAVDALSIEGSRYVLSVVRRPAMVLTAGVLFIYSLLWQAFTAFYPTYLIEIKGLSPALAGTLFGLFFAIGVVVKPLAGAAYDRIGIGLALAVVLVGPVVGLLLLPTASGVASLVAVTVLVGTMLGSGTITQSYLADALPRDMRGSGLGAVRSTVFTLGASGPLLFGLVADHGYFDEGYLALAVLMVGIILLTRRIPSA